MVLRRLVLKLSNTTQSCLPPNKPTCTYLQPNDGLIQMVLADGAVDTGVHVTDAYQFIVSHGGDGDVVYDVPTGNNYVSVSQSLGPECVLTSETGTVVVNP